MLSESAAFSIKLKLIVSTATTQKLWNVAMLLMVEALGNVLENTIMALKWLGIVHIYSRIFITFTLIGFNIFLINVQ